ncbi:MAG: matrixin family metalloprotease [Anaerocolumna sp.]
MKNKVSITITTLLSLTLFIGLLPSNATYARTLEDVTGIPIHFAYDEVDYNQDYLNGNWSGLGDNGAEMWDTACSEVICNEVSFSTSNLDIVTGDNYDFETGVIGVTNIFDSDGTNFNDSVSNFDESGETVYASIYLNPDMGSSYSTTLKKAIICHEVGHVLGLYHPASSSTSSIMSSSINNSGFKTSIQQYDKDDISDIY